jgi:hypothetical protein
MNKKQIHVSSQAERDEIVAGLVAQRYEVLTETEQETHLALPRIMFRDYPMAILLTLCGIIPGLAYVFYLQFGPRREVIVTIAA